MNHEIPAPGPQTILKGRSFIASVNRVAEFIRQWGRPSLVANRRADGVIYALHTDPAAEPIELTVDDLEAVLRRAMPANYPDREELAREIFVADNWRADREAMIVDFNDQTRLGINGHYFKMADVAIDAFRKVNR